MGHSRCRSRRRPTARVRGGIAAVGVIGLAASLVACGGPQLRETVQVKPKAQARACGPVVGGDVPEEQALCIARLAGLRLDPGEFTIRAATSLVDEPIWVVEERCSEHNPRCIGITIRRTDGAVVNTRYLYVEHRHGPDSSGDPR